MAVARGRIHGLVRGSPDPTTVEPSASSSLLSGAAIIGLGYGWIALQTRSLAFVAPAHALTDASGVLPVRANWLTPAATTGQAAN